MKETIESFLGLFMLILVMVGGMSIVSAGIDADNATATKTSYVAEIENSNFSASVLSAVLEDAAEKDFGLSVDLYHQDAAGQRTITEGVTAGSSIPDTSDVYMARLSMTFDYSFPMFNSLIEHELIGYAR